VCPIKPTPLEEDATGKQRKNHELVGRIYQAEILIYSPWAVSRAFQM
jgi:hypothetical protein